MLRQFAIVANIAGTSLNRVTIEVHDAWQKSTNFSLK